MNSSRSPIHKRRGDDAVSHVAAVDDDAAAADDDDGARGGGAALDKKEMRAKRRGAFICARLRSWEARTRDLVRTIAQTHTYATTAACI